MQQLIREAQNGNNQALEALWERTKAFAFTVSRRFRSTSCVDSDDLQQAAWLGFYAAVQKHEGRYHFLTLLDFCIRNECRQALHIRTSKRDPVTVSYDAPAPDGEQSMIDLFVDDALPEHDASLIGADLARDVRAAVAELPERERTVIETRWLSADPLSLDQTGDAMGISRERTRQLEARAFARLRDDPILQTYAPRHCTSSSPKSGLSRFLNTGTSCTEREAVSRIQHAEAKQKQQSQKHGYAGLLESLAAEGFLDPGELETLLPMCGG